MLHARSGGHRFTESCHVNVVIMPQLTFCASQISRTASPVPRPLCAEDHVLFFRAQRARGKQRLRKPTNALPTGGLSCRQCGCIGDSIAWAFLTHRWPGVGRKRAWQKHCSPSVPCSDLCTASRHWGQRSLGAESMTAGRWAKAPAGGDSPMVPDADGGGPGVGARH